MNSGCRCKGLSVLECLAGVVGVLSLALSALWWYGESVWGRNPHLSPEQAFADGSFGLELAPLRYILVADELSKTPLLHGQNGLAWTQRFGFLPRNAAGRKVGACAADAPYNLPVGFSVSRHLPGNATPTPVQFVGLSCAACHSARFTPNGDAVLGAGSTTADVIGFTDAFLNAVLDTGPNGNDGLTAEKILAAYERRCPGEFDGVAGGLQRRLEAFFIDSWLKGFRAKSRANIAKFDLPYHGAQIGDPEDIPAGPSRTRPFRSVVRATLHFPGSHNKAYSKIPTVAMQKDKSWSQFDGSIGDPVVRSMIAVFASGTSVSALDEEDIADNIRNAAAYTSNLGKNPLLPTLAEMFPQQPAPSVDALERGRAVYLRECANCHGYPDKTGWIMPPSQQNPPLTGLREIGTDSERILFRYHEMIPAGLSTVLPQAEVRQQVDLIKHSLDGAYKAGAYAEADWWKQQLANFERASRVYPAGHRRSFPIGEVATRDGYQNSPLPFMWMRAPYLHNGSVLTLRALIGLEPRPPRFCRGTLPNYDPAAIGLKIVAPVDNQCPNEAPFLFDTAQAGNSAAGHVYPYPGTVGNEDLESLLAYLGTL